MSQSLFCTIVNRNRLPVVFDNPNRLIAFQSYKDGVSTDIKLSDFILTAVQRFQRRDGREVEFGELVVRAIEIGQRRHR
jgi:hypothetical protein